MLGAVLTRDSPENANPSAGRDPFTAGERNRERSVARGVHGRQPKFVTALRKPTGKRGSTTSPAGSHESILTRRQIRRYRICT